MRHVCGCGRLPAVGSIKKFTRQDCVSEKLLTAGGLDWVCWHDGAGRISLPYWREKTRERLEKGGGCPGFVVKNPGLGLVFWKVCIGMPTGLKRCYGRGRSALHHVQLLPAIAVAADGAGTGCLRERIGKSARRDGVSAGGVYILERRGW